MSPQAGGPASRPHALSGRLGGDGRRGPVRHLPARWRTLTTDVAAPADFLAAVDLSNASASPQAAGATWDHAARTRPPFSQHEDLDSSGPPLRTTAARSPPSSRAAALYRQAQRASTAAEPHGAPPRRRSRPAFELALSDLDATTGTSGHVTVAEDELGSHHIEVVRTAASGNVERATRPASRTSRKCRLRPSSPPHRRRSQEGVWKGRQSSRTRRPASRLSSGRVQCAG